MMNRSKLFPTRLSQNDFVRIIAPAGPFDTENLKIGESFLKDLGFQIQHGQSLFKSKQYLAGTDPQRADDLIDAFADDLCKGIFCARGGYGSVRLLPLLDMDMLSKNPKTFWGFSDITALSMYFYKESGLITFSGPMPAGTQVRHMNDEQKKHFLKLLTDPDYRGPIPGTGQPLIDGTATGPLLGGNLTILTHCAAAGILPDLNGAILLIEDVNEAPYRIDRSLATLKLGGHLDGLAGVVAGDFIGIEQEEINRILVECFQDSKIPVISGYPIGHGTINVSVPIGVEVTIDADCGTIFMNEGAVC